MIKHFVFSTLLGLLIIFEITGCSSVKSLNQQVNGKWTSLSAENLGNGTFGYRTFDLTPEKWEIRFTLYLDEARTTPVFTFRGNGSYKIEGPSTVVPGASNVVFYFSKKYLTLHTDNADLLKNFGFAGLDLQKDVEKDISAKGASFLPSVQAYGQEYDLLQLKDGQLYFGMRSNDMSTPDKRPTKLFYPLKRK